MPYKTEILPNIQEDGCRKPNPIRINKTLEDVMNVVSSMNNRWLMAGDSFHRSFLQWVKKDLMLLAEGFHFRGHV